MRKHLLLSLGLTVLALPLLAAEPAEDNPAAVGKIAASRIVHVTVYPNSALVTREVDVPAGAGSFELVVTPLPPQTIDSSLYSEGGEGLRILTTRFRTRPVKEDTREGVRKLQDDLRKLQEAAQKLQADINAVKQNMLMLNKLEDFTAVTTKTASEKAALNSESVIALSKYVMDSRATKTREMVGLEQDLRNNHEQAEFVGRQLQDLAAGTTRVERDAVIVVDKGNGAAGKLRLNYLVNAATWRPQYKLRAGKDEKEPVQLEYLAAVMQQTGEDWAGVQLTLSTAQPMLNAAPPDLMVLEVAVTPRGAAQPMPQGVANPTQPAFDNQSKQLRAQGRLEYNKKDTMNGANFFNEAAALDQTWQLLYASRDDQRSLLQRRAGPQGDEGPSVTYHIPTRLSVPSRHDEQVLEVARLELAPEYFYKAVPVLTTHIYRQANLTNKSKYVLLPGEATMYQGSDFVGRMNLPLVAIGEQFTAGFGVDPQLQVQRVMMDKQRNVQGGNQVLKFEYRILINSYKAEPVSLQLWDRLPHAEVESVGISLLKTTPELSKDVLYLRENRPNNLLRWDLKVDPAMNGEKALVTNFEFQMALDKQMAIGDPRHASPAAKEQLQLFTK